MGNREGRKTKYKGIKDLGNGTYCLRIVATPPGGKRVERQVTVQARSVAEALEHRIRIVAEMAAPPAPAARARGPRSTLGEVARVWLDARIGATRRDGTSRLAPTTRARYEHAVGTMIAPFIGERVVGELTRGEVEAWRDHLGEHYAASTVNGALTVLRMILRDAEHPVADRVKALEVDDTRITEDEPNALDDEQVGAFLAAIRDGYPQHLALVLVLLTSGQRISTVLALRWEDVDARAGTITFRRRLSEGTVLPGVKRSRTAKDVAPLLPVVRAELELHRRGLNEEQRASGLVFPAEGGGHRDRGVLRKAFEGARRAAGIRQRFTVHGCRRTSSALYRRAAGSVVAKAIVGHTTDAMHAHYAVVDQAEKAAAARGAFRMLGPVEVGPEVGPDGRGVV